MYESIFCFLAKIVKRTANFILIGEKNSCYLSESTFKTFNLVKEAHPTQEYTWIQIPGYGHLDCILGKAAVHDVYPHILKALDAHAEDDLLLDENACNSLTNAVASLKSKVCKFSFFFFVKVVLLSTHFSFHFLFESKVFIEYNINIFRSFKRIGRSIAKMLEC